MGFFGFGSGGDSKTPEEKRADDVRTGKAVPTHQERKVCWRSRDAYYACLDRHGIVNAEAAPEKARSCCESETLEFERDCPAAWIPYFKKWRVADLVKKRKIAQLDAMGAQPLPVVEGPASPIKST